MALKILMATMSLGIGGAETHIIELARALKRRGMDVIVASHGGVYVSDIEENGIRHFHVPMNRRNIFYMLKSYFMLRRIIRKEKPDIVHAHARISAFICGLLRKTMRFSFVTTAHGVFQLGFGLNQLTNWGQKTIAVSEDIKAYLTQNYGIAEHDIIVTINGIDTEKFSPLVRPGKILDEFGLKSAQPVICHVSRLDESSSLVARQLIALAPQLSEALPGVQILIAGGGGVYAELKEKAMEANAVTGRETVVLTDARTDISEIVSAGDLFIGVSRAALEAMAEAKPVILAGSEGYIGLLTPDKLSLARESNFCCRGSALPSETRLFEEILRSLKLTPDERGALGEFGRRLVVNNYSVMKMTDDCMKAYEAVRKKRHHVVMSGYYGFGNAGDEAILQSIHQNIEACGEISVTVLSNDPEDTKRRYGYEAVNRFGLFSVIKSLKNCDALVSGGGSLLQDYTSTRSLFYYLMIIFLTQLMKKKVMIYANGIGPVRKKINRRLVRHIVGRADVISLRDDASAQELKSMGIDRNDILVTADPVFTLAGAAREEAVRLLGVNGIPADIPFVCVSVRNWSGIADFKEKVAGLCDNIIDTYKRNIVLIAMQTPNDVAISLDVQRLMKNKAYVLDTRLTAEQIMGIIGLSDFVLAMRLHTLIFSARMCVPLIGIVYDPKVAAYVKALEMPSAGNVVDFDAAKAMSAVNDIMQDRERYVCILKGLSNELESLAQNDARELIKLLETPKAKRRT